jgi:hypothetical protein
MYGMLSFLQSYPQCLAEFTTIIIMSLPACIVVGVISSTFKDCPGFAPDVELHTFKVFTDDQVAN